MNGISSGWGKKMSPSTAQEVSPNNSSSYLPCCWSICVISPAMKRTTTHVDLSHLHIRNLTGVGLASLVQTLRSSNLTVHVAESRMRIRMRRPLQCLAVALKAIASLLKQIRDHPMTDRLSPFSPTSLEHGSGGLLAHSAVTLGSRYEGSGAIPAFSPC